MLFLVIHNYKNSQLIISILITLNIGSPQLQTIDECAYELTWIEVLPVVLNEKYGTKKRQMTVPGKVKCYISSRGHSLSAIFSIHSSIYHE